MSESIPIGTAKKWIVRSIVIISLGWTIYNWSGLTEIKDELSSVLLIAVLLVMSEVSFVIGAVLMLIGAGKSLHGASGWIKGARDARKNVHFLAEQISTSKLFRLGFNLNWFGAVFTGAILLVGIILVLPATAWGLAVLPTLDIVASFGWRIPIDRKIRALKESI